MDSPPFAYGGRRREARVLLYDRVRSIGRCPPRTNGVAEVIGAVKLTVLAALAVSLLPFGAAHAQQPNPAYCIALFEDAHRNLNDHFADYIGSSRVIESSFRIQARRARESHDSTLLRREYRKAKRVERREALSVTTVLGAIHENYRQEAAGAGCDPNALVGRHGSLVVQVGANHVRRLRRLHNIYSRAVRALRS